MRRTVGVYEGEECVRENSEFGIRNSELRTICYANPHLFKLPSANFGRGFIGRSELASAVLRFVLK